MASIGSLSSGTSNSLSGIKGFGGLASGLDRDSLIEGMTIGTRTKIANQLQKKQIMNWKQEAYRSVSSKMIDMTNKYTSFSSATNLASSAFFSKSLITATGANSKYVQVSGSLKGGDALSIIGVKQLATDAKLTSKTQASDQILQTGFISTDLNAQQEISNLEGKSIYFTYGNEKYQVRLQSGTNDKGFTYDYTTPEKAAASINESLKQVEVKGGKNLGELVEIEAGADGKFSFKSLDTAGNTLALAGGTSNVLRHLGFVNESESFDSLPDDRKTITSGGLKGNESVSITKQESALNRLAGKRISFNYNGVAKQITLPEKDKLNSMDDLVAGLQKGLDTAFGAGRIKVGKKVENMSGEEMASLQFTTTTPPAGGADTSSVLKIVNADDGILGGNGALKVNALESNRINTSAPLYSSGISRFEGAGVSKGDDLDLTINGVKIEGLTYSSSLSDIMKKINENPEAGVNISYLEGADKFVVTANDGGAGGRVELSGKGAEVLFGNENTDYAITKGQDAIVTVKYQGSDDTVDIVRGSNSFKVDGLSITVNEKFGFDETVGPGNEIIYTEKTDNEAIKLTAKSDTEKVVNAVKDLVKDFNELLELVNEQLTTKPNRNYAPLTEEQKAQMSEDEIKTWEEKAKEGMLFNDSELRGIMDSMRFLISGNSDMRKKLEGMGITTSTAYAENGKLIFDEEKFKSALEADPVRVQEVFTKPKEEAGPGEKAGLMVELKSMLDKYAATTGSTKGILVERAGSKSAPTTMLKNSLQKEMDTIDKYVTKLESKLAIEQNRYVKQFTNLETVISQLNSQSSWLAQQFS